MGDKMEEASMCDASRSLLRDHELTSFQCEMGVYPFMFGSIKDFEPVAQDIIKVYSRL